MTTSATNFHKCKSVVITYTVFINMYVHVDDFYENVLHESSCLRFYPEEGNVCFILDTCELLCGIYRHVHGPGRS